MSNKGDCRTAPATPGLLKVSVKKTSLLCRLQAQTLTDATPPIDKSYLFTKMAVTFEPVMQF